MCKNRNSKIVNLLNGSDYESLKFSTKMWYIISDQNNGQYGNGDENDSTINLKQKSLSQISVTIQMLIFL